MSIPTYDFTWEQGTDLPVSLVYKESADGAPAAVPADFGPTWSVRMDVAVPGSEVAFYSFNSEDFTDGTLDEPDPAADNEAIISADGTIRFDLPRSLTLTGGAFHQHLVAATPVTVFNYDIILRNPSNKQQKLLSGSITINKSVTKWV